MTTSRWGAQGAPCAVQLIGPGVQAIPGVEHAAAVVAPCRVQTVQLSVELVQLLERP